MSDIESKTSEVKGVQYSTHEVNQANTARMETARGLKSRHIQLISIGGVIGTGLFVGSGRALIMAGPLSCLIAYSIFCLIVWAVAQSAGELASLYAVNGSFIHWTHRFIDPAAGVACGWNYAYACIAFAAADVVAVTGLFQYWLPDTSPAIWVTLCLVVFFILNAFAVRLYGEAEFYFASGKVILIIGLIVFTFVVMVGGNPQHDVFGFRYWKDPGPMAEYIVDGALGRFLGFWGVFRIAAFSIGGPEFVSMCSGEAENPRRSIPKAIRRVFWRLAAFYVLGILCVGILVAYNDADLIDGIANGTGVGASPFVIGMQHLGISVLPDIMNAIVITSAVSCGNSFIFVAVRSIHALALQGQAPRLLGYTTQRGVPLAALLFVLGICSLSYMTVDRGAAVVFGWFIDLSSVAALINFFWICLAWIRWDAGIRAQGLSRDNLPFRGILMPYTPWFGLIWCVLLAVTNGFAVFINIDGDFDVENFLTAYFGFILSFGIYGGWKLFKRPSMRRPETMDLTSGLEEVDADEAWWKAHYVPPSTRWGKFVDWLL
ncbi:amino acid permease/ SLC12A domain-containing protein [Schizophyllum amplum]|uniref:Amino acid permease/ SLC12A domain-containing protein n=1 Tax=Schizophyllum amplum TaxID=97359 RepID=A0A550CR21_9AGAR|nr:amino acid permease/ SLC12A domain-containing protein [Auriculariopsis ampla]